MRNVMRSLSRGPLVAMLALALAQVPSGTAAQERDDVLRVELDGLLESDSIDVTLFSLAERYFESVMLLIPGLDAEGQAILADAAVQGFEPLLVRAGILDRMVASGSHEAARRLVTARTTGPEADLEAMIADFVPEQSFEVFRAELGTPPADRLQLLAALAEARGGADLELFVDDALGAAAYRLVTALGGDPGPYVGVSDEAYESSYRQRLLSRALELMYRLQPVPDTLVARVTEVYRSEAGRWWVDEVATALQEEIFAAGARVEALLVPTEAAVPAPAPEADPELPCRGVPCGYLVEWQGRAPTDANGTFGASGDLDPRVLEHLVRAGYRFERGAREDGLTIRVRARTMLALCDFMSGTDNRGCTAIDNVRVEFIGSHEGGVRPGGFQVRNRCGAEGVMGVDGFSFYVAQRVHHALTLASSGDAPGPPC
jgi:hypothetical protein